jgi:tetratricopeptide (TPR) repeat protein
MKKTVFTFLCTFLTLLVFSQDDPKVLHETGRNFMRTGDYNNAIIVLNRALELDKNNLEMQKDLVMTYYLKRDFTKALEGVENLVDRNDADVMTFQIAGNVYKAMEEVKDCEKMYKKALKKFPKSGPLYSEYGELLWAIKDFSAINFWEKGIQVDPAYSGNYYNAALYYFHTQDKVWSLIYGEIFVNMESMGERGAAMKELLLTGYKEKMFAEADLLKDVDKNKSEFAKAFLRGMSKQSSLASKGISTEILTMIRTRFILDWYTANAFKYPFRLFDYQQQLIREGMFDAYNQWLFGSMENLAAYENWTKTHSSEFNAFSTFQKSRVFRIPANQYYQVN